MILRDVPIAGYCDERFAAVADELRRNLECRGELGASVAVVADGELVVDLWGGWADADRSRPWQRDTLCLTTGCTFGVTALCAHLLATGGELDLDAPVARYWPQYAAAGKAETLVRHLLTHEAGLPALRAPLPRGAVYDWERMTQRLAAEAPFWAPGTAFGYHALTSGFLIGELVRRVSGLDLGEFLRSEIAGPLDLDYWIGLPESEHERVTHLRPCLLADPDKPASDHVVRALREPDSVQALMLCNTGGYLGPRAWDSPAALSATIPATGGVGNARALARLYGAVLQRDTIGRFTLGTRDIERMSRTAVSGDDVVLMAPHRWTVGFDKLEAASERAFGTGGFGGSIAFADPGARIAFGYVMNQMTSDMGVGDTGQALIDAAYRGAGDRYGRIVRVGAV